LPSSPRLTEVRQTRKLTWTREPRIRNFNDWTIVVDSRSSESGNVENYHVHKSVVGVGHRGSKHFLEAFKANSCGNATTVVGLEPQAAKAFPAMLDYMYSFNREPLKITTSNAVSLRYLGNFLGVGSIFEEANQFIKKDMGKDNLHAYLKDAQAYKDGKLIKAAIQMAAGEWQGSTDSEGLQGEFSRFNTLLSRAEEMGLYDDLSKRESRSDIRQCG
jgi:hypothetical protein